MKLLFRRMLREDDLLVLISENDTEAKLLMKLGQLKPSIVGRTPPSDGPNYTVTSPEGKLLEAKKQAQLQILFMAKDERIIGVVGREKKDDAAKS